MIQPPLGMGAFEFVAIARLRAAQLARGCRPRVAGDYNMASMARREVADRRVTGIFEPATPARATHGS